MDPQTELPRPWKDDKLKKRLIGALVVMIGGFVLVSVLPRPDDIRPAPETTVVTIPLREGDVMQTPPPPSAQATPPSVGLAPPDPESAPEVTGTAPDEVEATAAGDDDAAGSAPSVAAAAPPADHEPEAKPAAEAHKPAVTPPVSPSVAPASKPMVAAAKPAVPPPSKPPVKPDAKPATAVTAIVPATTPVAKASAATISSNGNWFVQTGGFAAIANARQAQQQVQARGLNCILSPIDTDKGTIYRVRAGPFASREIAQAAQAKLASAGMADSKLVAP